MAADWSRWRARAMVTCALGVAYAAVAGCTGGGLDLQLGVPPAPSASAAPQSSAAERTAAPTTGPTTVPTTVSSADPATMATPAAACVAQVYGQMTLAQRVGQLFIVGVSQNVAGPQTTAALEQYHFGSLLLGPTAEGVTALRGATAHMQSLATSAITGGARFFIAANQEGGQIQPLTGPGFATMPSALTQGSWSASELRQQAAGWGGDLRAAGVNLDLAPVMDVVPPGGAATNAPVGELDREFGFDPGSNGAHGAAFIKGMAAAGVATSAKHFPGLGRVAGNTDFTAGVVDSVTTPTDPSLGSFRAAIDAGVPFVMVALATYTQIDSARLAVFSPAVMRLLRSGLGFHGVIISDDLGNAAAVAAIPAGQRAVGFLAAGGDMITSQSLAVAQTMASAVLAQAAASSSFRTLVDAAARQVLEAKQAYGLLGC